MEAIEIIKNNRKQREHETSMFVSAMGLACAYARMGQLRSASFYAGKAHVFASGTNEVGKAFVLVKALESILGV